MTIIELDIMSLEQQLVASLQLILALTLSALIGLDRERRDKDAGLRTHMLVGAGACLFTLLSAFAFPGSDSARVAANIVTGVGFLGAGVIYRSESRVHDLTTAASIWITAAIGMAVGTGAWFLAIVMTLLVWIVLRVIWYLRRGISHLESKSKA
ncbi:MAG: MgtC/SapB family protein [Chloroflexi bacterium]|nr:MgtC/SapB family protein [Chloroflexota bacterium]